MKWMALLNLHYIWQKLLSKVTHKLTHEVKTKHLWFCLPLLGRLMHLLFVLTNCCMKCCRPTVVLKSAVYSQWPEVNLTTAHICQFVTLSWTNEASQMWLELQYCMDWRICGPCTSSSKILAVNPSTKAPDNQLNWNTYLHKNIPPCNNRMPH